MSNDTNNELDGLDKAYVSPYDKFMAQFDAEHSPSLSQQQEIAKHQRIAYLRDKAQPNKQANIIWEDF